MNQAFPTVSYLPLFALLIIGIPLLLLIPGLWKISSSRQAQRHFAEFCGVCTMITCGASAVVAAVIALHGPFALSLLSVGIFGISVFIDVFSVIMLLLVSFLGAVVMRYSINYLDGDLQQGRFAKWLSVTIGSVLILVISGNLLMFALAWMATSLSLHKLLTFYAERPGAMLAAHKKFLISRVGDVAMIGILIMTYRCFGTWEFQEIFVKINEIAKGDLVKPDCLGWISAMLVACAILKSAQFPFHSWLPDTMETPTPVSALMHAGIINAGGFLIVRFSPLVSLSPSALNTLAIFGVFTALFASLIMLTQTSVKRSLAYSTIAQMGFMMLQCGLGAFALAVLHLVAHSLYKAHAFLSSGSLVAISKSTWVPKDRPRAHPGVFLLTLLVALAMTAGLGLIFGVQPDSQPSLLVLGSIFMMALASMWWNLWTSSHRASLLPQGLLLGLAVGAAYFTLHAAFDYLLRSVVPHYAPERSVIEYTVMILIVILFMAMLFLQAQLPHFHTTAFGRAFYVHAYKGFYFVALANRIVLSLTPKLSPRQS